MKNEERRKQILEILSHTDQMAVSDLVAALDSSPATVRRDIRFLEENGFIAHRRGNVRYLQPQVVANNDFDLESYSIAKTAAGLIEDGDIIILDSGKLTLDLASQLGDFRDLTVITNSVPAAALFANMSTVQTYVIGGYLRTREAALIGPETVESIRGIHASKLFLTTTGIRGTEGLSCVTPYQADVKRAFVEAADEVILLIGRQTFSRDALTMFATFDQVDCIVTSGSIESEALRSQFDRRHIRVIEADSARKQ